MKVANILRRFSFEEWGGTETAVWNALKEQVKLGVSPEILSTSALSSKAFEIVDEIPIRRFPYFYPQLFLSDENKLALDKKGGSPFSFALKKYLLNSPFDLMHSHAMGRVAELVLSAARKRGVPFALSFHGGYADVPKSEIEEMLKPLKGSLGYGRILEKILNLKSDIVSEADGIVCVGKNEYDIMRARHPEKEIALIPNGVDFAKFNREVSEDFRAIYGIPKNAKLLLCVSRIDYQKNQRALVPLAKNLSDKGENVHVAIIGFATSQKYFEALSSDIKNSGIAEKFTVIAGLPPDSGELISAYKSADAFVLPSLHEPFGIVALEAWSAGIPLAAARVGGLAGIVREGENGFLFDPKNLDEMTNACMNALAAPAQVLETARRECIEEYSWGAIAKKTVEFYEKLLERKK